MLSLLYSLILKSQEIELFCQRNLDLEKKKKMIGGRSHSPSRNGKEIETFLEKRKKKGLFEY